MPTPARGFERRPPHHPWWAWLGQTTFSTRFDTDDVVQRVLTLLQMFIVTVMAVNAKGALDGRDSARSAIAISLTQRIG
jgi:low temperature requirement protein LtrA